MFTFTEEQLAVQEAAKQFAHQTLLPTVIERDKTMTPAINELKQMGEMGFMGMMVPPEYNGAGMNCLAYVIAMEEISKIDNSTSVCMSVNNSLVCDAFLKFATDFQKEKYLTKLSTAEWIGAFCLSEPEAGSDATHQRTIATPTEGGFLINGTKNWITNGFISDLHIVFAQTDKSKGHRGITAFLVESKNEGVEIGVKEDKLGIRGSDTTSIMYTNVFVPTENILGEIGKGFKVAMKTLEGGRIGIAAQALGIASGALELSVKYAKEREAFGKPIAKFQGISFKLAEMATQIEAARLLIYKAAKCKDEGKPYGVESSMAKLYASEVAMKATVEAVQIHGGYGYVKEYHVERLMRDAKITQIYEGTSEVQKIVISRDLLRD